MTVRRAAAYTALLGLLIYAFVALAGPALEPDEGPMPPGAAAADTMLAELVNLEAPAQGGPSPEERRELRVLSNGCTYSARGIPRCGVLLGAAYGANTDPLPWERAMGHPLGVRRTYWAADQVDAAVSSAQRDLQLQRLPWMSFKLPHSWEGMRDGLGDEWARALATQLSQLDGPVWVAFHHEPEGDGDVRAWTAMQARLAPIVRKAAPNVAYSVILTGWHQLYGAPQYRFSSIWPENTEVDIAGFDVYNKYGALRNGHRVHQPTDFEHHYFRQFSRFAESHDIAWALAETGQTDRSAEVDPHWLLGTYMSLLKHDGIAFSYFNSTLNSNFPWRLIGAKEEEFAQVLRTTPTL